MNFSSNYSDYDEPKPCPYCGANSYADFVDIGIGMTQCGPYHCEACHAYELKSGYNGDPKTWTTKEQETGWREPAQEVQIECIVCKKSPNEIDEYIDYGKRENMTPTEFVKSEEGTFNRFLKNKFYCTSCYIKAGQPAYK